MREEKYPISVLLQWRHISARLPKGVYSKTRSVVKILAGVLRTP